MYLEGHKGEEEREGKGREEKRREGKGREGKIREEKDREGKRTEGTKEFRRARGREGERE